MNDYEAGGLVGLLIGFLLGTTLVCVLGIKTEHGMSYRELVVCAAGNMTVKDCVQLNLKINEVLK